MELKVAGGGTLEISDGVFGAEFKQGLVHQVVTAYMAGARAGTKAQKTRSDVSGGGRKPYRQKGTGQARQGTIRSPLFRGGGVTFAARPRNYEQKVNRKMYRGALRGIWSELIRQDRLLVTEQLAPASNKTKDGVKLLADLGVTQALLVVEQLDDNLILSTRNLYGVDVRLPHELDPVSLVGYEKVVITTGALKQVEERLA